MASRARESCRTAAVAWRSAALLGMCVAAGLPGAARAYSSLYWVGGAVRNVTTYYHVGNSSVAADTEFTLPSSGRLRDLHVVCDAPLGAGAYTYTVEVNGSATPLSCDLVAGECADSEDHTEFEAGDRIRLAVIPSTDPEPDLSIPCRVSASLFASGSDVQAHNSALSWGSIAAAAPADGSFCGPASGLKEGPQQCNEPDPEAASFIMPAGAVLAGLAVHLGAAAASDEIYTVRNITQGVDTDLSATVTAGSQQASSTQCTANCEPAAGDLIAVRLNLNGSAADTTRHVAVEFASIGTIVPVRGTADATVTTYGNSQVAWASSAVGAVYRVPRSGHLHNLWVQADATPASPFSVSICAGPTNPPDCGGPSCEIGTDGTSCNNIKNGIDVAQGDFFELALSPTGANPPNVGAVVEISGPACVGDCNGSQDVTVDELVTMVAIALGTEPIASCTPGDVNHDDEITVDEILTAVNNALNGCPPA